MTIDPLREVSGDIREAASALRQMYVALLREGFTETQALALVMNAAGGKSND